MQRDAFIHENIVEWSNQKKMALILNRTVSLRIQQMSRLKAFLEVSKRTCLTFEITYHYPCNDVRILPHIAIQQTYETFIPRLNGFIVVTSLCPFWNAMEQKFSRSMATIIWLLIHLFLCSFMCFVYSLKWAFVQTCNTPYTTCSMQGRQK